MDTKSFISKLSKTALCMLILCVVVPAFAVRFAIDQARANALSQAQRAGIDIRHFSQALAGWISALTDGNNTVADDELQQAIDATIAELRQKGSPQTHGSLVPTKADCIPLPADLQNERIFHVRSAEQQGNTACGYQAVYNLIALRKIIEQNQPITTAAIKRETDRLNAQHGAGSMFEIDEQSLANARSWGLEGSDTYLLTSVYTQQEKAVSLVGSLYMCDAQHQEKDFDTLMADFKKPAHRGTVYFLCNFMTFNSRGEPSGHWVASAIIKQAGQPAFIVYLNSSNAPVENDRHAQQVLHYVSNL